MDIYQLIYGLPLGCAGKVLCCFHKENSPSAFINAEGQFHCFGCETKAHDDTTFIKRYFNLDTMKQAGLIKFKLKDIEKYIPKMSDVNNEQRQYLNSIGINDEVINKYFKMKTKDGALITVHNWNNNYLGYTIFNAPALSTYNAGIEKYKYSTNTISGMCNPYDIVDRYNGIIICEGEKDAFTLMSQGHKASVSKLGGAGTPILPAEGFRNKTVVIIYDCDDAGKRGAMIDATILINKCNCKVKVIDLGLQEKEDLNDYFMKYNHSLQDLYNLIRNTDEFIIPPELLDTPVDKIYKEAIKLSFNQLNELKIRLDTYIQNGIDTSNNNEKIYNDTNVDIYLNDLTK